MLADKRWKTATVARFEIPVASQRVVVSIATMLLAGCSALPLSPSPKGVTASSPLAGSAPTSSSAPVTAATSWPLVAVAGAGWTAHGLGGVPYTVMHCTAGTAIFRGRVQPLPDPRCTPGAIDTAVTQATIGQTICRYGGFTESVRPPYRLTEPAKYQAMTAYGDGWSARPYEFDHLVPLELGGASTTANLWPERNVGGIGRGSYVHNSKDQVENDLHSAVCSGQVPLAAAQQDIAANWTTAEAKLGVAYGSGH